MASRLDFSDLEVTVPSVYIYHQDGCTHCERAIPEMQKFADEIRPTGLRVVNGNVDVLLQEGTLPKVVEARGEVPVVFFFDGKGRVQEFTKDITAKELSNFAHGFYGPGLAGGEFAPKVVAAPKMTLAPKEVKFDDRSAAAADAAIVTSHVIEGGERVELPKEGHLTFENPSVVLYKASWCPHCTSFEPEFKRFVGMTDSSNAPNYEVYIVDVDESSAVLPTEIQGRGVPTVVMYGGNVAENNSIVYNGPRKAELLLATANQFFSKEIDPSKAALSGGGSSDMLRTALDNVPEDRMYLTQLIRGGEESGLRTREEMDILRSTSDEINRSMSAMDAPTKDAYLAGGGSLEFAHVAYPVLMGGGVVRDFSPDFVTFYKQAQTIAGGSVTGSSSSSKTTTNARPVEGGGHKKRRGKYGGRRRVGGGNSSDDDSSSSSDSSDSDSSSSSDDEEIGGGRSSSSAKKYGSPPPSAKEIASKLKGDVKSDRGAATGGGAAKPRSGVEMLDKMGSTNSSFTSKDFLKMMSSKLEMMTSPKKWLAGGGSASTGLESFKVDFVGGRDRGGVPVAHALVQIRNPDTGRNEYHGIYASFGPSGSVESKKLVTVNDATVDAYVKGKVESSGYQVSHPAAAALRTSIDSATSQIARSLSGGSTVSSITDDDMMSMID